MAIITWPASCFILCDKQEGGAMKIKLTTISFLFFAYCFLLPRYFGNLEGATTIREKGFHLYKALIAEIAAEHNISPALVAAMIKTESDFRSHAISPRGAVGLMQMLPSTARWLKVGNIRTPHGNISAGVKYLKTLLKTFNGNVKLAIAAYNAGPNAVKKFGKIPPYPETKRYVARVLSHAERYKREFLM